MSRGFWIVLIVSVALTLNLCTAWKTYRRLPYTSVERQRYNMEVAERELPRVNAILAADRRFQEVKTFVYTGQDGAVGLIGKVEKDEDLFRLMKAVASERLPVAVSWQIQVLEKNDAK